MNTLKLLREQFGLTITDVANKLNISRQAVSMWEMGRKPIPRKRKMELARLFGVAEIDIVDSLSETSLSSIPIEESEKFEIEMYRTAQEIKLKTLTMVESFISGEKDSSSWVPSIHFESMHIVHYSQLLNRFMAVIQDADNLDISLKVLRALEISLGINLEHESELFLPNPDICEYIKFDDNDELIQWIVKGFEKYKIL